MCRGDHICTLKQTVFVASEKPLIAVGQYPALGDHAAAENFKGAGRWLIKTLPTCIHPL